MKVAMLKSLPLLALAALFLVPSYAADFLFGRRVYSAAARTYQQVWSLDSRSKKALPLTTAPRRHVQPLSSTDSQRIWFLSGAFGDEKNTELWSFDLRAKTEKLALTFPGHIARLLGGTGTQAFFSAYDEKDQPALYRWNGKLAKLAPLGPSIMTTAALSPDGRILAVQTGDQESVVLLEPTGVPGHTLPNCGHPVWSIDAKRLACVSGSTIHIMNVTTGVEAAHTEFTHRTTPPAIEDFAPEGNRLLVKTVGANHNSTSPQSDYWIWEIGTGKWTFVGPGQSALFASAGNVLLVTPRELTPIGKGKDWTSEILLVDPATHAQTPLAPAATSNAEPSRCRLIASPAPAAPVRKTAPVRKAAPATRRAAPPAKTAPSAKTAH